MGKLTNEFKIVCGQNEELKKRLQEGDNVIKKIKAESDNKVNYISKECERLNSIIEKKNSEIRALGGEVQ